MNVINIYLLYYTNTNIPGYELSNLYISYCFMNIYIDNSWTRMMNMTEIHFEWKQQNAYNL